MPTTPRELAAQILDRITGYPENFDMNVWMDGPDVLTATDEVSCGTTLCVAGWAAHLSGWALVKNDMTDPDAEYNVICQRGNETADVEVVAGQLLGLNRDEAGELFFETSPKIATEMVRQLANGQQLDAQAAFHTAYPGRPKS